MSQVAQSGWLPLTLFLASSPEGLAEIVEKGGVLPLVTLLEPRQPNEVKEQALLTFGKVLFAPGRGRENIQYFFQCGGERSLIECMNSEAEEVQVPALSIIHELSVTECDREILRKSNIEEKLKMLENHANVVKVNFLQEGDYSRVRLDLKLPTS